jgi:glyoxylase-like metal-dependent hydrolase (beta-lactamase superfamily II)
VIRVAKFTFSPFQENTYVLHAEGRGIIVDPGCWNSSEEHELESWLDDNGVVPERLVLTHAHVDHVFGCAWIHERYGLLPEMHRADLDLLRNAPRQAELFGVSCAPSPEPVRFLDEGDVITLGEAHMDVLFTPGHAPGHIALWCPREKMVISGDVLFHRSIGRVDLPGGDFDMLANSIREKLYRLGDEVVVYCGHGPETTIGEERRLNPFVR